MKSLFLPALSGLVTAQTIITPAANSITVPFNLATSTVSGCPAQGAPTPSPIVRSVVKCGAGSAPPAVVKALEQLQSNTSSVLQNKGSTAKVDAVLPVTFIPTHFHIISTKANQTKYVNPSSSLELTLTLNVGIATPFSLSSLGSSMTDTTLRTSSSILSTLRVSSTIRLRLVQQQRHRWR
jgi:hypothetical protein